MENLRDIIEGLPEQINVIEAGGVVAGVYKTKDEIMSGEFITGRSFLSTCSLPDVKPNTKIIGVCGISDWNPSGNMQDAGLASPKEDGWFFSDFYLFHHLFKDVASDQIWMTCVSPEYAVNKYGEYIHGDSAPNAIGSRRVVLDKDMLEDVRDVKTVASSELLERVLSTIREACRDATIENRPLLILIFTHGIGGTFALQMGGGNPERSPHLTMASFKRAIGSKPLRSGLCLLTTSCFGGGWAINPNLNITSVATQYETIQSSMASQWDEKRANLWVPVCFRNHRRFWGR